MSHLSRPRPASHANTEGDPAPWGLMSSPLRSRTCPQSCCGRAGAHHHAVRFPDAPPQGLRSASTRPAPARRLLPQPAVLRESRTPTPRVPRSPGSQGAGRAGAAQARALAHLHGVQGEVAGDLELLPEDLLLDVIDAHELGHASRQDALAVRRVAQGREGPEQGDTGARQPGPSGVWSSSRSPAGTLLGAPARGSRGTVTGCEAAPAPSPRRDLPTDTAFS